MCTPGGCLTPWMPDSASRPWLKPCTATAGPRSSTPTTAANSPASSSAPCSKTPVSPSLWTAGAAARTTSSSSGSGARSSTRRSTSTSSPRRLRRPKGHCQVAQLQQHHETSYRPRWGHPSRGLRKGNAAGDADQAPRLACPSARSTRAARRVKQDLGGMIDYRGIHLISAATLSNKPGPPHLGRSRLPHRPAPGHPRPPGRSRSADLTDFPAAPSPLAGPGTPGGRRRRPWRRFRSSP